MGAAPPDRFFFAGCWVSTANGGQRIKTLKRSNGAGDVNVPLLRFITDFTDDADGADLKSKSKSKSKDER